MNYVYPKLSEKDLGFVRLGGAGLGNILFTYARAVVFAKEHNLQVIWPTWFSFKLGPVLRREMDKRFYNDLFDNNNGSIGGLRKMALLATKKKVPEAEKRNLGELRDTIIEFTGFEGCFEEILYDSAVVYEDLKKILKEKNKKPLEVDFSDAIGVHIRLGDFGRVPEAEVKAGRHDSSLPIYWYSKMIEEIRKAAEREIKAYIFSDGTQEELEPVLKLPNVERITFGSSIADIIGLSRFPLFVASGSSFSMWARYLGRMSTICYPNQIKQHILTERDSGFECEVEGELPEEIQGKIRQIYR